MNAQEHKLKCWPPYFEDIASGRKNFEVRFNDRKFKVGDVLVLQEYVPSDSERIIGRSIDEAHGRYTQRSTRQRVRYVLNPLPGSDADCGLVAGFVVLGLEPIK
jgi:Domain of unknown function (DUF3850)